MGKKKVEEAVVEDKPDTKAQPGWAKARAARFDKTQDKPVDEKGASREMTVGGVINRAVKKDPPTTRLHTHSRPKMRDVIEKSK